jgi:hypothetical protein
MTPTKIAAATVTASGAVDPATGLSISAAATDFMLTLQVTQLTAVSGTPRARIVVEDTEDAFTNSKACAVVDVVGPVLPNAPLNFSWKSHLLPSLRVGTASAKVRLNVIDLAGTTPTLTLDAQIHR